jgi:hypothetical protein
MEFESARNVPIGLMHQVQKKVLFTRYLSCFPASQKTWMSKGIKVQVKTFARKIILRPVCKTLFSLPRPTKALLSRSSDGLSPQSESAMIPLHYDESGLADGR